MAAPFKLLTEDDRGIIIPFTAKGQPSDQPINLPETFLKTIKTYFPKLGDWMYGLNDPRMENKIKYELAVLLWIGIFLFFFKLEAGRNLNFTIGYHSNSKFLENFKSIFPILGIRQEDLARIPDYGTLIYALENLPEAEIEKLQVESVKLLIRQKKFDKFRLFEKYFLIAFDGTQEIKFNERHCEHCLTRKIGEDEKGPIYQYYHNILVASLVGPNNLAIPVLSEFIENESPDISKQDCERNAFYRLSERLNAFFPRTNICIIADSLYACDRVMSICKENKWLYIIAFKSKSIPNLAKEYEALAPSCPENTGFHMPNSSTQQKFQWVNDLAHQKHSVNCIDCNETKPGKKRKISTTRFRYITNIRLTQVNYRQVVKGGRFRQNIEDSFNTQKNRGYNLTHMYGKEWLALKNFCRLLFLGFSISKMMELANLIKNIQKQFGSFKLFYRKMLNAFSEHFFDNKLTSSILESNYQIRLNSS